MNPVIELMLKHTSIRKFKDDAVSGEDLQRIFMAAQSASTSSFLQAYSILNITDPSKREKLKFLCGNQEYVEKAPVFLVFCADLSRIKSVFQHAGSSSGYESGWTEMFIIATVDASLAAQNALLAAESLGLGGVYIGGIRNNPEEVSSLLSLPEEVYPVFGMCLGYPDQFPEIKERLPMSLIIHENTYSPLDPKSLESYDERSRASYLKRTHGKISDSWSESVHKKLQNELREHMKPYLQSKKFMIK